MDHYIEFELENRPYHIRVIGSLDDPYFCGKDVCCVLGCKDMKKVLKQVNPRDKKSLKELKENTSYHEGKAVYVNKHGLVYLLQKGKTVLETIINHPFVKKYCENMEDIMPTKEQNYISDIIVAFMNHKMTTQYEVDDYRIDLYFLKHKIAVDCVGDKERQKYIKDKLGCKFIYFNPDKRTFNIFALINEIMQAIYM